MKPIPPSAAITQDEKQTNNEATVKKITVPQMAYILVNRGMQPVRCGGPDGKKPLENGWPNIVYKASTVGAAFAADDNVGINLGAPSRDLICVDLDCDEAINLAPEYLPATGCVIGRPGRPGAHWFYFCPHLTNSSGGKDDKIDVLSTGKQVIVGPSVHKKSGETYDRLRGEPAKVDAETLTEAVDKLRAAVREARGIDAPAPKPEPVAVAVVTPRTHTPPPWVDQSLLERRASAYVAAMPPSIAGQHGHDRLFAAAGALVNGFGLDTETAFSILRDKFNPTCVPPWSEKEIRHKVDDAATVKHREPLGYLCDREADPETVSWVASHAPAEAPSVPVDATGGADAVVDQCVAALLYDNWLTVPGGDDADDADVAAEPKECDWGLRAEWPAEIIPATVVLGGPVAPLVGRIAEVLARTKRVYRLGDGRALHIVRGEKLDRLESIDSTSKLIGAIVDAAEVFAETVNKDGGVNKRHTTLPINLANATLNSDIGRSMFPQVRIVTHTPVYAEDWRLIPRGYDDESRILNIGENVSPRRSVKRLRELLDGFCFASAADRANYLGFLLTCILRPHFVGNKPALLLNGNQPGVGKSTLAQVLAVVNEGKRTGTLTFNSDDAEFERTIGAAVNEARKTIVIDNAKAGSGAKASKIDSACLERSITDAVVSFRLIRSSNTITCPNSFVFAITANAPDLSPDLVSRCVVVNLAHVGDTGKRSFRIADPVQYAIDHRAELLGELLGMVERWIDGGKVEADIKHRFGEWARIVGGILECHGERNLLANGAAARADFDPERRDFAELMRWVAERGEPFTASDAVQVCKDRGLLVDQLGAGNERSRTIKFGTLAARFVGETFAVGQSSAVLSKNVERVGARYSLTPSAKSGTT